MEIKEEFNKLVEKLKTERDEINLKIHLASLEAQDEYKEAEKKWQKLKSKASQVADDTVDTTEDFIAKSKIVGEELKETYRRISDRLSK